jgi:DNA-binding transcriptional ArsR family regulator
MKPFMVVKEPEAFQLLADETRRKILYLLRVKEMTVSQLSSELGLTSQAVYHHVRKLLKGKMIEVTKEERMGHLIESYYRATAEDFLLSTGKISSQRLHDKKLAKDQVARVLNALNKLGFNLKFDENKISQIAEAKGELEELCTACEKYEDDIWNMEDLDLPMREIAIEFAAILLMSEKEYTKQLENRKILRDLLLSLLTRAPAQKAAESRTRQAN